MVRCTNVARKIAREMKNSPFIRARYVRMIAEAEQYHFVDAVKEPDSTVSDSPLEFSSSQHCWNSPLLECNLVSEELDCQQPFPTLFTLMWAALALKWQSKEVQNQITAVKCAYRKSLVDHQGHHRITVWLLEQSIIRILVESFQSLWRVNMQHCVGEEPKILQRLRFMGFVWSFGEIAHQHKLLFVYFFHPRVYIFYSMLLWKVKNKNFSLFISYL